MSDEISKEILGQLKEINVKHDKMIVLLKAFADKVDKL